MNPSIDRKELTLAINEIETACNVAIAIDAAKDYGLSKDDAQRFLKEVQSAIGQWQEEAKRLNIPKAEQELMAEAFQTK
jgi:serine/threonine-protein kinase HipA